MISESYLRATLAHYQDLLREAEKDRLTYGALLRSEQDTAHVRMNKGLRAGRVKVGLALATSVGILLIAVLFLAGGAPGFASMLP